MLLVHLTWALDMFPSDVAAKRAGPCDLEQIRLNLFAHTYRDVNIQYIQKYIQIKKRTFILHIQTHTSAQNSLTVPAPMTSSILTVETSISLANSRTASLGSS